MAVAISTSVRNVFYSHDSEAFLLGLMSEKMLATFHQVSLVVGIRLNRIARNKIQIGW